MDVKQVQDRRKQGIGQGVKYTKTMRRTELNYGERCNRCKKAASGAENKKRRGNKILRRFMNRFDKPKRACIALGLELELSAFCRRATSFPAAGSAGIFP